MIRKTAFEELGHLVAQHGGALPWEVIARGFVFRGKTFLFANQARGIFKPAEMPGGAALSIKTTVPREGRTARYDDLDSDEGFVYRFQGDDPKSWDNQLLYQAHVSATPIIYFYGLAPSVYQPIWPAYIVDFDAAGRCCRVVADDANLVPQPATIVADTLYQAAQRRYVTVLAKRRVHQQAFRLQVLEAYEERCAICRLPRRELLDAAHIVPDRDERGVAEVKNGLALCKLHHGVFDADLLGIRPSGLIEIAPALLDAKDGPTLEQGIKSFHGKVLHFPRSKSARPAESLLERRFEQYLAARR
ncbi:HNH endonuclease [Vulgatibacter sp.]|uniref:HNH endonuclease n=1 Tax=Vulgatibacter sp. TaxID=1971226 RepID=UPI003567BC75